MKKFICFTLMAMLVLSLASMTVSAADPVLTLQADQMTLGGDYEIADRDYTSNGKVVTLPGDGTGDSSWVETKLDALEDGVYDIVFYFNDENDGEGTWLMEIAGKKIVEFVGDVDLGSPNADADSYTNTREYAAVDAQLKNVSIKKGDSFKLTYTQNFDSERGRLDKIEFYLVKK